MTRLPRLAVADQPLHIIHRGNNRQAIFFAKADYQRILADLAMLAKKYKQSRGSVYIIDGIPSSTPTTWFTRVDSASGHNSRYHLQLLRIILQSP